MSIIAALLSATQGRKRSLGCRSQGASEVARPRLMMMKFDWPLVRLLCVFSHYIDIISKREWLKIRRSWKMGLTLVFKGFRVLNFDELWD